MTYFFIRQWKSAKIKAIIICDNFDRLNIEWNICNDEEHDNLKLLTDITKCEDKDADELIDYLKAKVDESNIYKISSWYKTADINYILISDE